MEPINGEKIKKVIWDKGLDVKRVAEIMGKYEQWLSSKLQAKDIGINLLFQIANACNCPVTDFIGIVSNEKTTQYGKALQSRLIDCLDEKTKLFREKDDLYKELVQSERQKVEILMEMKNVKANT